MDDFSSSLSEVSFNINEEITWLEGLLLVAKLFYNLFEDLVNRDRITADEVEKLKTREYTKNYSIQQITRLLQIMELICKKNGIYQRKPY